MYYEDTDYYPQKEGQTPMSQLLLTPYWIPYSSAATAPAKPRNTPPVFRTSDPAASVWPGTSAEKVAVLPTALPEVVLAMVDDGVLVAVLVLEVVTRAQ